MRVDDGDIAELESAIHDVEASGAELVDVDASGFKLPTLDKKLFALCQEISRGRGCFLLRGLPNLIALGRCLVNVLSSCLERSLTFLFLISLLGVATSSIAADKSVDIFEAAPHKPSDDRALPARHSEVLLRNGNVVGFARMESARGRAFGIGVYEIQRAGNGSIRRLFDLHATDPVELFLALTTRGTEVPSFFGGLAGRSTDGENRGWALDKLVGDTPTSHDGDDCSDSWRDEFRRALLSYGETHADIIKSTGPVPDPWLWDGMLIANRFSLKATGADLRSIAMSVRWCGEGSGWGEPSLHIRFDVRHTDAWEQKVSVASVYENGEFRSLAVGDQVNFHYAPYSVNNDGFEAKLSVDYAREDDLFHVGVTWSPALGGLEFE